MSSLKEIARELSVSVATVSNALNGKGKLSDALRRQIIRHARKQGYEPSPHARVLHGKRLRVLGLILPSVHDGLAQGFIDGTDQAGAGAGYSTLVAATHRWGEDMTQRELAAVERFHSLRIGGVLYLAAAHADARAVEKRMEKLGLPFVRLYRGPSAGEAPSVLVDHAAGIRQGISHLQELGHRRIALIHAGMYQGPELEAARAVYAGFFPRREWERWSFTSEQGWRALLTARVRSGITAALALSDDLAFSASRALTEAGVPVPEAFSLVGFRDTLVARTMTPALTTLHVPTDAMAAQAAGWLIRRLEEGEGDPAPIRTALEPELVVRASTAPPARCDG